MSKKTFKKWLWEEFKNFLSELSIKTKLFLSFAFFLLIIIVLMSNSSKSDIASQNQSVKNNGTVEIMSNSKSYQSHDQSEPDLLKRLKKGKLIYEGLVHEIQLFSNKTFPIGEPVLVEVLRSNVSEGIVISTNPLNLKKNGIIIHLDGVQSKFNAGKLLIFEVRDNKIFLNEIVKNDIFNKLQQTAYALQGE